MELLFECSKCGEGIVVLTTDKKIKCHECKQEYILDEDADFIDGRWYNLTKIKEINV